MRRRAVLALLFVSTLISGCGRLGFDPLGDGVTDGSLATAECPMGYARIGPSCYRLGDEVTWAEAEVACEADAVGAHLVTIDNASEGSALLATFAVNDYWIGMTDRVTEGAYRNVTGESAPYLPWIPGEPSSDDCGQFDDDGLFHLSDCDSTDEYMCELDGRPSTAGAY